MSVALGSGPYVEELRRRQLDLLCELREVEHWRRLVAARLDLAVAAVTAIDEPVVRDLPAAPALPCGLRQMIGLADPGLEEMLGETAVLEQLRAALHDLDRYAHALRTRTLEATQALTERLTAASC